MSEVEIKIARFNGKINFIVLCEQFYVWKPNKKCKNIEHEIGESQESQKYSQSGFF